MTCTIYILAPYTYEVETDKKIVIKNGAVFKWSAYQDTFRITDMLIENGAVFQISPFDFMSKAVVAGTITNQGDIQVTSARGECFFTASIEEAERVLRQQNKLISAMEPYRML